jgi:hypothetical protein
MHLLTAPLVTAMGAPHTMAVGGTPKGNAVVETVHVLNRIGSSKRSRGRGIAVSSISANWRRRSNCRRCSKRGVGTDEGKENAPAGRLGRFGGVGLLLATPAAARARFASLLAGTPQSSGDFFSLLHIVVRRGILVKIFVTYVAS